MHLTVNEENQPDPATVQAVRDGLIAYNRQHAGPSHSQPLCLIGRDDAGVVQAGLMGVTSFGWLFVDWFWVADAFRHGGHGSMLLQQAEDAAKRLCGLLLIYLQLSGHGILCQTRLHGIWPRG